MIPKSGTYWSTGITIRYRPGSIERQGVTYNGWAASLNFYDGGFCNDDTDTGAISTQGNLSTRYFVRDGKTVDGLTAAIDVILADAKRIGIEWRDPDLYYEGGGENPDWPQPAGWGQRRQEQLLRIGWGAIEGDAVERHAVIEYRRAETEEG